MSEDGIRIVSANDDRGNWVLHDGMKFQSLYFGVPDQPSSPVAVFVKAPAEIGDRIAGLRTHSTPVFIAVIDGWIELDGSWLEPGDFQVASANAPHGDLVIGPDGATFMLLFAQRSGLVPTFLERGDQEAFDASLRDEVERAAKGDARTSFALLPGRKSYRPRRGIKMMDEVPTSASTIVRDRYRSPGPGVYRSHIGDDDLPWGPRLTNARSCMLLLGDPEDPSTTVVGVIDVDPGPGDRLRGRHIHYADAVNLVIDGALYMDGVWLRRGEAKVVDADVEYGDGLTGPEGVRFFEIWSTQSGAEPVFSDAVDQDYFEHRKREGHLQTRRPLSPLTQSEGT